MCGILNSCGAQGAAEVYAGNITQGFDSPNGSKPVHGLDDQQKKILLCTNKQTEANSSA
jgi:hypothetical protein